MNQNQMARLLTGLKLALPQWAPSEINTELSNVWLIALNDFDDRTIKKAMIEAMQNLTSWPAPATIKRLCLGTNQTDEQIGSEIASRIEGAISRFGYSNPEGAAKSIGR